VTATLHGSYGRRRGLNPTPSPLPRQWYGPNIAGRPIPALDLCRLADITYRQLDYWCVTFPDDMPIVVPAKGSGTNRWYRAADIPKYHVLGRLSSTGLRVNRLLKLTHQQRLQLIGRMRKLWREAGDRDE
jgi:hypothetical protein